jgi:hypothetical protein
MIDEKGVFYSMLDSVAGPSFCATRERYKFE